jgi:N-methylhydantoinase B/oxoprolinase/acetone carboxylase alpha subunit
MSAVDPISLEVFKNLFAAVAEEMGVTLQRASFSPNIRNLKHFAPLLGRLMAAKDDLDRVL